MNRASDQLLAAASSDPALAQLCDEIIEQLQAGDDVDVASLALEYPEHADQLRRLLPALGALVDLGASSAQPSPHSVPKQGSSDVALTVLGDYRILREIGRGGMGVVYEAEQRSLLRRVALKVLPMAAALDARQFQRFQIEAQAAACLHHNNIVPVFAVGTEGGVPFYAMQFIDGRSLSEVIHELRRTEGLDREPPKPSAGLDLPLADLSTTTLARSLVSGQDAPVEVNSPNACPAPHRGAMREGGEPDTNTVIRVATNSASSTRTRDYCRNIARLGLQAADALDHAHTRGILHRDIKPGNLLRDAEGRLWVADFGLAQIQGNHGLTLTGDVLGTLRYMSPEQALARRVVIDGRTDIYSLGVTLYELLTLQPAFDGKDRAEILRKIENDEPTRLRKVNPSVPQDMETIIQKAMAKEPSGRYATARELADDLRNYLEARPIRARRPSLLDRAAKWARRHTASVAAASVILVLAMIGLAASTILIAREQRRTASALTQSDARLQIARKAVDEMYTQVAEKWLGKQPRLTRVQREFLEKALAFYEQFAAERAESPQARFESASARLKVGSIQRAIGMLDDSERALQQAVNQLDELATQFPERTEYLSTLARAAIDLGGLEFSLGRRGEAESTLKRSVTIMEGLVSRDRGNRENRCILANGLLSFGEYYIYSDHHEDAEPLVRRSRDLFAEIQAQGPVKESFRKCLPACEQALGRVYSKAGRLLEAEDAYRRALKQGESLLKDDPADPSVRYELAAAHGDLATLLDLMSRSQESLEHGRQAVAILEALVSDFPDVVSYRGSLVVCSRNDFFEFVKTNRLVEAEQIGQRCVQFAEALVHEHPNATEYLDALVVSSRFLAELYNYSPAGDRLHKPARALELARRAVELKPEDHWCLTVLGEAQYRSADWKGCIETLTKSMRNHPDKEGGYGHWLFLAMAYWQLGDKEKARSWFVREVPEGWDRHEKACEEQLKKGTFVSPHPPWIRKVRAEAAALLGLQLPEGQARPKPVPETVRPPK